MTPVRPEPLDRLPARQMVTRPYGSPPAGSSALPRTARPGTAGTHSWMSTRWAPLPGGAQSLDESYLDTHLPNLVGAGMDVGSLSLTHTAAHAAPIGGCP